LDRPEPKTELAPRTAATIRVRPEPPPASPEELKKESERTGDDVTAEDAKALLLDEKHSSALKLAVIDKLRTQDAQDVIPVLVAFLEGPGSPAGIYTKPTAVKVLADLKDPRADEALSRLARTSPDERVRLTIAALQAKEKSR
jgi:HEAT repeat protein